MDPAERVSFIWTHLALLARCEPGFDECWLDQNGQLSKERCLDDYELLVAVVTELGEEAQYLQCWLEAEGDEKHLHFAMPKTRSAAWDKVQAVWDRFEAQSANKEDLSDWVFVELKEGDKQQ